MRSNVSVVEPRIKVSDYRYWSVKCTDNWILLLQRMSVPYRSTRPVTIRRRAEVGDRIRSLRRWRDLSQEDLGLTAGVGRRSIINIENGRQGITIDAALDIAYALDVPPAWLFSDDWTRPGSGGGGDGPSPNVPPDRQGRTTDE